MGDNGARRASWLSNQPVQSKMLLAFGLVLAIFVIGTVAAVVSQDQSTRARQLSTASYEETRAELDAYDPPPELVTLDGVGHFFHGRLRDLEKTVGDFIRRHAAS